MKINTFRLRETKQKLAARLDKYSELKNQRGMTLLEIIIVLGIIGVIAAGVVILAQRAYDTKAMTDLANNANTVRTAMKDAYGPTGHYPDLDSNDTLTITSGNYMNDPQSKTPIAKLMMLGKLSIDEAKNGISGNFINVGPAAIGTSQEKGPDGNDRPNQRGYYIQLNGLNSEQCRNLLNQMGNNWDYVQVTNNSPTGVYADPGTAVQIDGALVGATYTANTGVGSITAVTGVFRTTANPLTLTPDLVMTACSEGSSNSLILGSR